jgi:hypothetical protein
MQKLLFPLALLITLSACSQGSAGSPARRSSPDDGALDKFYDRFQDAHFSLDPRIMLNASFSGKETNSGWMHKVTQIRLLILGDKKTPAQQQEWSELSRSLRADQFDELVTIRKGEDKIQLLSKEREDGDKEIVFLAGNKNGGGLFFCFRGHFTEQDMNNILSALQDKDKE